MLIEDVLAVLHASRPAGWCFGPILFGIGFIHSGNSKRNYTTLIRAGLQVISLSVPLCIIVFGMNDVYDYESDLINPRKSPSSLEGGVISPVYHPVIVTSAYISTIYILGISLITRGTIQNFLSTVFLVFLGWQYSAPPLRLKEIPAVDSLSNGAIVLFAWFVGYSFGRGDLRKLPKQKGVVLALCTSGIHALGAAVDRQPDIASGQTTIATFFGSRTATIFGAATFVITLLLNDNSSRVFSVYLWGAVLIMTAPCLHLDWAHAAFSAVVYWSMMMVMVWFGSKVLNSRKLRLLKA